MEEYKTGDGSMTFLNTEIGDYYHSKTGAREEAFEKYAKPTMIDKFNRVEILDICFGLGYNSAAAMDQFKGEFISIIGIENDPEIISKIKTLDAPFLKWDLIKELAEFTEYEDSSCSLSLRIADAREEVKKLKEEGKKFDVVFFDAFSPSKVPEMWTEEVFKDIHAIMKTIGVLATYSCSTFVRNNLRTAGFKVKNGPSVGRRAPATLAFR